VKGRISKLVSLFPPKKIKKRKKNKGENKRKKAKTF
jgi:hypothetical protein